MDYIRGNVHARSGRPGEAEAAFAREIAYFPHKPEAYASLAALQFLQGKAAAAEETMERLVKASPGRESALFAAQTFEELGDARRAAAWRRRADRR